MTGFGHERRFRDVRDKSGLPLTPERLPQRSASSHPAINHRFTSTRSAESAE